MWREFWVNKRHNIMINIRLANIGDAQALTKINIDTWRSNYVGIVPDGHLNSLSYNEESYQRTINNPKNIVYVAEIGEELVGYVCSCVDAALDAPAPSKLRMMYVKKEFQNKGIGKKLFLKIAEQLHNQGYKSLSANTFAEINSNFFYSSLGGAICQKNIENIGGKDIDTVTYLFNLPIKS